MTIFQAAAIDTAINATSADPLLRAFPRRKDVQTEVSRTDLESAHTFVPGLSRTCVGDTNK